MFEEVKQLWNTFENEIVKLKQFQIPRYVIGSYNDQSQIVDRHIITMADCGKRMLGALAYLKVYFKSGNVSLGLLACKTRVRNTLTIAKGELLSLLDSVVLAHKI